jgi:hypothetical protein
VNQGEAIAAGCGLVALALPWVAYWLGRGDGYRRGYERARAEGPPCQHPPCALASVTARVELVPQAPRPDAARTHEITPELVEAARAQVSEERRHASGWWSEALSTEQPRPSEGPALPDLTKVSHDSKRKAPR